MFPPDQKCWNIEYVKGKHPAIGNLVPMDNLGLGCQIPHSCINSCCLNRQCVAKLGNIAWLDNWPVLIKQVIYRSAMEPRSYSLPPFPSFSTIFPSNYSLFVQSSLPLIQPFLPLIFPPLCTIIPSLNTTIPSLNLPSPLYNHPFP